MTEKKTAPKKETEKKTAPKKETDGGFNLEAFNTTVELTLEELKAKGGKLPEKQAKELEEAKAIAYKNNGRKAKKTDTYRVAMQTVRLVEGLPTPDSIVNLFAEEARDKLFF